MLAKFLALFCLVAPLFAAPTNNQDGDGSAEQGPPPECEKPFGEGKLATGPNPYNFTVIAKQRSDSSDYKNTFKGAPIDMIITFTAPASAGNVKAFALRCGLPFPVVQWQKDKMGKVVSCIAPQSRDTLVVKGDIGQRYSVSAVPLLAAWANHDTLPVIYEMALQGADGNIYVAAYNGTIKVKETDYKLPERFFRPPPGMQQQQNGQRGQDPRFQQQMGGRPRDGDFQQETLRKRREVVDAIDSQEDVALRSDAEEEEFGN